LKYPFDRQTFHFEILSLYPARFVRYDAWPEVSGLGVQLGEKESILGDAVISSEVVTGLAGTDTDKVTLTFFGHRHISYYVIIVFVPMLVLIIVGRHSFP